MVVLTFLKLFLIQGINFIKPLYIYIFMVLWIIIAVVALVLGVVLAVMNIAAFKFLTYILGLVILLVLFYKFFVRKYDEYERAVIFRFGKFHRVAGPGWSIVLPFFEKEYSKVDIRTKMIDLYVPVAFTSDDLRLKLDGVIYYRIVNPDKAILKIENYRNGLTNMIVSETRNLVSSLSMREMFGKLPQLNDMLANAIRHATWKWGIDVPMVQLRSVTPPDEIAVAMQQKEVSAQFMQAQKFKAEAKKIAIEAIGEAAKSLDDRAIMYLYMKALEEMSKGSGTKLVFPAQFMDVMKGGFGVGSGLQASGMNVEEAVNAIRNKMTV